MSDRGFVDYKPVAVVANAVTILRALAQYVEPVGVATIVRETGISASTCFNILRTLAHERIISFDQTTKTYRMAIGALEFSLPLLGLDQASLIRPELERLTNAHKSLICLWQFVKSDRIVLVDSVAESHTVRVEMPRGARLPAFAGAIGRCYVAHADLSAKQVRMAFEQVKWQSPPEFEDYRREVEEARRNGYAFDKGRLYTGLETAAALVADSSGRARFGISGINIVGTKSQPMWQDLAADLRDTSDWIGEVLFGVPRSATRAQRKLPRLVRESDARPVKAKQ